jgi:hypothetical protein
MIKVRILMLVIVVGLVNHASTPLSMTIDRVLRQAQRPVLVVEPIAIGLSKALRHF